MKKKARKKTNAGGARVGAGRKPDGKEATKSYTVSLMPSDRDILVSKYESLTAAIKTLL